MSPSPAPRRHTRHDLPELAGADRADVFAVLASFDDVPLRQDPSAFADAVAGLLDADRVPGLAAARAAGDPKAIAAAAWAFGRAAAIAATDGGDVNPAAAGGLEPATRQAADDALAHRFTFYDETHALPEAIDWDHNPGTAHWGHDLNRFSYLVPLIDAWRATGQAHYGRKAVELILRWIDAVDVGRCFAGSPYAWGSYLNNAIHIAAWARCLQAVLAAAPETPPPAADDDSLVTAHEWLRILKSWHDQIAYLEVVTAGHHGNWPTIGCQGILQVLSSFAPFRDTDRWIDHGVETLALQIDEQILPDGVQDELTPHYHAVVVRNLLTAARCLQPLGRQLLPRTRQALQAMVRYQQQTVVPSGRTQVAFNDSDPEVVPQVAADLSRLGWNELLRPEAELGPEVFPHAGVAFLRQRRGDGDLYLAFDGGPFGRSHQHEDMLGFWLHAYGRDLIVDPGRHLYDFSAASYLEHLRSTAAHSTICIDGEGQNARGRPDTWIAGAPGAPGGLTFSTDAGQVRAAARYDLGYGPENRIDVVHRRQIVFVAQRFWVVFDTVTESDAAASGPRRIESRFQFAPGAVQLDGEGRAWTGFDDANLLLWSVGGWDVEQVLCGSEAPRAGWYSARYGRIAPAPCLTLEVTTELPYASATLLFPYRGTTPPDVTFARGTDGTVTVRSRETGPVRVAPT